MWLWPPGKVLRSSRNHGSSTAGDAGSVASSGLAVIPRRPVGAMNRGGTVLGSNAGGTKVRRLAGGGDWIQTIGPALAKGLSAVAEGRCLTDKLDGVIKHRSSRETTMVGRGASLDGHLFLGGTDGSNPVPSSEESAANPESQAVPISGVPK